MFEFAHYSFNLSIIKVIFFYLAYINFGFFLLGTVGFFVEKVTKIEIPSVSKIIVGYAFYTMLAWWLFKFDNKSMLASTFIFISLCISTYLIVTFTLEKRAAIGKKIFLPDFIKKFSPFFILQLILISFWAGFLSDNKLHILTSGNNDIYFWGFMSDHVMGVSSLERLNYIDGTNNFINQTIDCFGVYSWLGLLGQLSMKSHSIEAAMLFQLSLIILSAWTIYEISVKIIGASINTAFIASLVFSFNPLWILIFINNYLSQLTATFCFLSCIFIAGSSIEKVHIKRGSIFFGFIFYLCFAFSYPGLLLPYIGFYILSIIAFNYLANRAKNRNQFENILPIIMFTFLGIFSGIIFLYDVTIYSINRMVVLSNFVAGWPLSMIDPLNLIGLISYSIHKTIFSNWLAYSLLGCGLVFIFFKSYSAVKGQSLNESRYGSLLFLSITALFGYLLIYFIKGESYQQWKFATYFPLPLLILVVVNYFGKRLNV